MAASYPIPEWLRPRGDPGSEFTAAFHAGASIAQEQQRLQAEQQRAAMAAAERMQIAKQESLEREQRIEVEKQYHQQTIGLRKQALDEAQAKVNLAAQTAARKFAGQQKIRQAIDAGMAPDEAYLKFGGEAFGTMAGAGALSKEVYGRQHPFTPSIQNIEGERLLQLSPNRFERAPLPTDLKSVQSVPVLDEQGNPRPGVFGVPGAKGGVLVRNAPKQIDQDAKELARLEKLQDADIMGQTAAAADEKSLPKYRQVQRQHFIDRAKQIEDLRAKVNSKSKVQQAQELHQAHPDWTKEQIIQAVNQPPNAQ